MKVAVVGAGLAGLATAAGLHHAGHEVVVFERAPSLRAGGLALNVWSNATSLLPSLGVPADKVPGRSFSRMVLRTAGREVAQINLPARGLPHVNVYRGELLSTLAAALPADQIVFGSRCNSARSLAGEHDLVVVADGANSSLRNEVIGPPRRRWSWSVWQATVRAEVAALPDDAGAGITRAGLFGGIWRLPGDRVTWFVEVPNRPSGSGAALLRELVKDEDPLLRELAAATAPDDWIEWRANDWMPRRTLHRRNVVLVGDAAHAMLPTLGQGACQALEDAAALTRAVSREPSLVTALRRYDSNRLPRVRRMIRLARIGAISRRPSIATRATPSILSARVMAATSGPILRSLTKPAIPIAE